MATASKYYHLLCSSVGRDAQVMRYSDVERKHGVTPDFVRYWARKAVDPLFHPGALGGSHNLKFDDSGQLFAETVLWLTILESPYQTPTRFSALLVSMGLPVDVK